MRPIAVQFLILGLAAALPANGDEIYRWVDHRGVVNYANQRPEATSGAVRVETVESRLNAMAVPSGGRENSALPAPPVRADFPSDVDVATMARAHSALPPRRRSGELR